MNEEALVERREFVIRARWVDTSHMMGMSECRVASRVRGGAPMSHGA
jgi:hypothetical protein